MNTYQVINVGNMWRVIDRSNNDKVLAFRESHAAAVEYAKDREFMRKISIDLFAIEQQERELAAA